MKFSKKNILVTGLAVTLATVMLISSGTFAYLKGTTDKIVNKFNTNKVTVDITETTQDYKIIPGTSQAKDPTVTVNSTIPAYVYVIVEDKTEKLVNYEIDEHWQVLGDNYPGVYWCEVKGSETAQTIPVLKGNKVFYDPSLENIDMLDDNGMLKEGITLTFQAKAIQKEPFNDPVSAYEEKVQVESTLEVAFENTGNIEKFVAVSFSTENSYLFQAAPIKAFYGSDIYWNDVEYTFSIKGVSNKDMTLSFDFSKKCDENGDYKGVHFEYGFGGFGDVYVLDGVYHDWSTDSTGTKDDNFTLVGDYYPVVFTVKQTKSTGITNFETFTGSLTELVEKLSASPYILRAGIKYDEEFEVTMLWPFFTSATDTCFIEKGNKKEEYMDKADTLLGSTANDPLPNAGYDLWADFEVMIQEAK